MVRKLITLTIKEMNYELINLLKSFSLIALPSFDVAKRQLTTDVRRMTLESRHELLDSYLFVILRNLIDNLFTFSQGQKPLVISILASL